MDIQDGLDLSNVFGSVKYINQINLFMLKKEQVEVLGLPLFPDIIYCTKRKYILEKF